MCIYVVIILCGILNYHVFWPLREFCYFDMIISVVSVVRFDVGITYYMKAYDNILFSPQDESILHHGFVKTSQKSYDHLQYDCHARPPTRIGSELVGVSLLILTYISTRHAVLSV